MLSSPLGRVAVAGHSMAPTLRDGDCLLYARLGRAPRAGEIVIAEDPRARHRWIVKRVLSIDGERVVLYGDAPGHDSPSVERPRLVGRVVLRYWPLDRIALL
jgi:signal peptidase I